MADMITTSGVVATEPQHIVTSEGLHITNFRLAAGQRRFNRSTKSWEYNETNWYTVRAFRQLANNLSGSITKKDRVLVTGRQRIRDWEKDDRKGTVIEIEADSVGHDLNWGTAAFTRSIASASSGNEQDSNGEAAHGESANEPATGFDPGPDAADNHGGWPQPGQTPLMSA